MNNHQLPAGNTAKKEKAPSAKTAGSKKNLHFIPHLLARLVHSWWIDAALVCTWLALAIYAVWRYLVVGAV